MKKKIILASAGALLAASCSIDAPETQFSLTLTPSSETVFIEDELPQLKLTATPATAIEGELVDWTSSDPSVISVNGGGVLTFETYDIEGETMDVTITAKVGVQSASCVITVEGLLSRYEIIDLSSDLGFLMLDRNVGATSVTDPGDFFQWGNNTPVTAVSISNSWSTSNPDYTDWSAGGRTPCPKGWTLMSESQKSLIQTHICDVIYDYETDPGFVTDSEYYEAKSLWNKMNIVPGGYISDGTLGIINPDKTYIWTGDLDEDKGAYAFYIKHDGRPEIPTTSAPITYGYNVRCVKSAE